MTDYGRIGLGCCHEARMEDDRAAGTAPAGLHGVALAIYRAEERARLIPGSVIVDTYAELRNLPATRSTKDEWRSWLLA